MKLWTKSIIGVGSVGVLGGAVAGGLYGYSKSDASKGAAHYSARGLENNLADFKKVDTYKASLRDPNNTATVLADYDIKTDTIGGKDAQQWIEDYIQKNGSVPPALFIQAGPIEFQNFYPEVILPKEYVNFIQWYSTNVPWTTDISSLSFYRIKRGIQFGEDGFSLTLGDYAAEKQTTKRIRFIPDSFFQQINASTVVKRYADKPFTKPQLVQFLKDVTVANKKILAADPTDLKSMVKVYSIEQEGDNEFYPTISMGQDSIYKIDKKSPFLKKKAANVGVSFDPATGETKLTEGDSYAIPVSTKIPRLTMWRSLAKDNEWKGVDIEWLKYVTHHEYGHMQTMGMVSDTATNPVQLGVSPNNANKLSSPGAAYDLDELNRYLEARAPQIRAVRVKVLPQSKGKVADDGKTLGFDYYEDAVKAYNDLSDEEKAKTFKPDPADYTNIAFKYYGKTNSWTRETLEDIFGSGIDISDANSAPYKINIDNLLADIKAGKNPRFFMQTIANLRKFAKALGIPASDVVLMNAFDNYISTTTSHISSSDPDHPVSQMMYMVRDGSDYKWVKGVDAITTLEDGQTPAQKLVVKGASGDADQDIEIKVDDGTPVTYHINPLAKNNNGELIKDNPGPFIEWFKNQLVPNLHSAIQGRKDLHSGPTLTGAAELDVTDAASVDKTKDAFKKDPNIQAWLKNPAYSNSANLATLFADYTYLFAEVLTRDWLQMSMVQDDVKGADGSSVAEKTGEFTKTNGFKYQSEFGKVNVQNTGLELYVDPKNFLSEDLTDITSSTGDYNSQTIVSNSINVFKGMYYLYVIAGSQGGSLTMGPKGIAGVDSYFEESVNNLSIWKVYDRHLNPSYSKEQSAAIAQNYLNRYLDNGCAGVMNGSLSGYGGKIPLFGDGKGSVYTSDFNSALFVPLTQISGIYTTNNGWSEDRWLRSSLTNAPESATTDEDYKETGTQDSWVLYDNNGDPIQETDATDTTDRIKEIIPTEDKEDGTGAVGHDGLVDNRVRAFWNFFLQARGIGTRTVSKIWRVPDRDSFAMWGYVPLEDANHVKYVEFKNKATGEVHYEKVKIGNVEVGANGKPILDSDGKPTVTNQVDNLFYYEHQADQSSKHTLEQDGYTGWTLDFLTAGTWFDSELQNGEWEMDFVDGDHKEVTRTDNGERLMSLGASEDQMDHKDYITENGYRSSFASVYIQRQVDADNKENGKPVIVVKNQFPL